jgi:hypothetical protein
MAKKSSALAGIFDDPETEVAPPPVPQAATEAIAPSTPAASAIFQTDEGQRRSQSNGAGEGRGRAAIPAKARRGAAATPARSPC